MPAWFQVAQARVLAWLCAADYEHDFDHELDAHLAMAVDQKIREGLTPAEARRAARLELGGEAQLREAGRAARGLPLIDACWLDVKVGIRMLRTPFAATAIMTLAVGMGATTGIFSAVNAALFRPLPYPDQAQIYALGTFLADGRYSSGLLAPLEVTRLREGAPSVLQAVLVQRNDGMVLAPDGDSVQAVVTNVSKGYFDLLGSPMAIGRGFADEEHRTGHPSSRAVPPPSSESPQRA